MKSGRRDHRECRRPNAAQPGETGKILRESDVCLAKFVFDRSNLIIGKIVKVSANKSPEAAWPESGRPGLRNEYRRLIAP